MKPIVKVLGLATVLLAAFSFKKYNDYSEVINAIRFKVSKIRNIRRVGSKVYATFDLILFNPTSTGFDFDTSGLIAVRQIDLFYKDQFIGSAVSDITRIELPANSGFRITNIQIEIIPLNIISQLEAIINNEIDFNAKITIQALGQTYVIDQPIIV
ncbi:MAG: hypothetical protein ACOVMG_05385 [Flavobacterium sp.]